MANPRRADSVDTASVTVQLEPEDLKRFNRFAGSGDYNWRGLAVFIVAVLLIGGAYFAKGDQPPGPVEVDPVPQGSLFFHALRHNWPSFVPIVVVGVIFLYLRRKGGQKAAYEAYAPGIFEPTTYEVLERGLLCRSDRGETVNSWHVIVRFAETEKDIYVMLAARNGHILPKRCFPTLEAMAIFRNQMQMHLEKHAPAALAPAQPS
jgi:hypothetical protein